MVAPQHFALPRVTSARPAGLANPHPLPRQGLGDPPSAPSRPSKRHDLSPRRSLFAKNRLILKPSKLTLAAGAVTVAAVAGIAIGTTTGHSTGTGDAAALNQARVSKVTSHSAVRHSNATQAPATHHAAPAAHRPAKRSAPMAQHRAAAKPAAPYLMYDSVIPSAIPRHHVAAVYATGPFAASSSQVAGRGGAVVWIDTRGTDPAASALDVEPGDATPSVAASWALHRLSQYPHATARIYTMISEWAACKAAVAGLLPRSMQARVRWWIADPNGVDHLVPGSDATQWYWGSTYDISTVTPRF